MSPLCAHLKLNSTVESLVAAEGFCVPPALAVTVVTQLGGSHVNTEACSGVLWESPQLFSAPQGRPEGLRQI